MENIPIILGQYRLGKTLGIGAFGKVKLACHIATEQKVAIKILNKDKIKTMDMSEKVQREINILNMLQHPHIIGLYEVIDTPQDIFVVMEYVSGGELFDFIVSRGRLPADEARRFLHQIISAVEYCHYHKIVHRDLKPENLLLDADNNIKLADFGLSNVIHDGNFLRTSCGSPNYAAPEVISGHLYAGPEVDVWSCGVILYAVLCGTLPFDDESIPNLFKKIKSGMYSLPSHLSQLSRDLILRMLVVDPMKRITVPEIRKHPWFQQRLPAYLSVPPELLDSQEFKLDDEIVRQVASLPIPGVAEEVVIEAVLGAKQGSRLKRRMHDLSVAYELLLRAKRYRLQIADIFAAQQAASVSTTPISCSPSINVVGLMSSPNSDSPRFGSRSAPSRTPITDLGNGHGPSRDQRRRRWYLGIQSKKDPAHVMTEVYKAMHVLGCTWSTVNSYRVLCRYELLPNNQSSHPPLPSTTKPLGGSPSSGDNSDSPSRMRTGSLEFVSGQAAVLNMGSGQVVHTAVPIAHEPTPETGSDDVAKMDLEGTEPPRGDTGVDVSMSGTPHRGDTGGSHETCGSSVPVKAALSLYKVQQSIYLLDFQRVEGDVLDYMRLCALIITELKNLSAASRALQARVKAEAHASAQDPPHPPPLTKPSGKDVQASGQFASRSVPGRHSGTMPLAAAMQ